MNPFKIIENRKIISVYSQTLNDMDKYFINHAMDNNYALIKSKINKHIKANLSDWRLGFYQEPNHQVPLLYAIVDVSRNLLSTGRYNYHLGLLRPDGEDLLKIFDTAAGLLVEFGKTDKADVKAARKDLMDAIAIVG